MAIAHFLRQLDGPHYRRQALQVRVSSPPRRKPGDKKIIKSDIIKDTMKELTVAEEELHQQYEELLAAHQALLEERYRYQQLFNDAPNGYLVTDTDGVIQEASRAASVLLHRRQQHLVGKPLAVLVAPPDRQQFYRLLSYLQVGQDVGEQDIGFQLMDGTRLDVVLTVNTVRGPWGQASAFRWLLRDSIERAQAQQRLPAGRAELEQQVQERTAALQQEITARKCAEETLARQFEELRHYNSELQQFANVVSHDLRQPLFTVSGALELLGTHLEGKLDAQAQRFLDLADKGTRQMGAMITDLLTYVRVDAQRKPLTPTDSMAIWQQTLQTLQISLADSRAIITADPLPMIKSNGLYLTLLFQNLLSNALKFRGPEPPHIHVWARPQGAEWVFAVQDHGIGIDAQHAERIFEMFQRGPAARDCPGTGMGLAICKKIIEQHKGRIWVESAPGKGATFFFTLPAA